MARLPITLADLGDFAGRHDRQHRADELALKADVASAKLQQNVQQHSDKMHIESAKLNQGERHHSDDMALARSKLEYERERNERDREAERETALIQARTGMAVAEIEQRGAMSLERLRHSNAVGLANAEVTTEITKRAHGLAFDHAASYLKRGEDCDHALSNALGSILAAKAQGKITEHLAEQAEGHRSNERSHEIIMACLQSRLRNEELTHSEVTRLAVCLIERASSNPAPPTPEEVDAWIDTAKQRGVF
ncbi:MAG: hypothetical protein Q7R40_06400 [Phaeospirillum sp.]|nr:hypothetical protein [Phaeospirillum sp.]